MQNQNNSPPEAYRHEFKYQVCYEQIEILKQRLPVIMEYDRHAGPTGKYQIRSLYFDDLYNTCYYENENGTDPREKFRIRIYNASPEFIRLEMKRKEAGKTLKKSCPISEETVRILMNGGRLAWSDDMDPLMKKLYLLQETRGMKPKVIVEYDRIPFVNKDGNVRITLDLDIRTTVEIQRFFDADTQAKPIMPVGSQLLEVKYDEFLPDAVKNTVQVNRLRATAFSKYYLCKKYGGII